MDTSRQGHARSARPASRAATRGPRAADAADRAQAERRTRSALDELDARAWTVVGDLEWPGGRYGHVDHVVVGPSGVYVVDTRSWGRDVTVFGGRLRHEGISQDAVVSSVQDAARAVSLLTPGVTPRLVRPVVVVDGGAGLRAELGSVLVCSTDQLVPMLQSRVHSMSTHQMSIASQQLRDHLHDGHLVKVAARAGHSEAKKAKKPVTPMRGVPVIRIAIAVWFAATLILAPHVFFDAYDTIHHEVQQQVEKNR